MMEANSMMEVESMMVADAMTQVQAMAGAEDLESVTQAGKVVSQGKKKETGRGFLLATEKMLFSFPRPPSLANSKFVNREHDDASRISIRNKVARGRYISEQSRGWKWQHENVSVEPTYLQPIRKVFWNSNGQMVVVVDPKGGKERVEDVPIPVITNGSKPAASSRMIVAHHENEGNPYDVLDISKHLLDRTLKEWRAKDGKDASICSSKGKHTNKVLC